MSKNISQAVADKLVNTVTNKVNNKINQLLSRTPKKSKKTKKNARTQNDTAYVARSTSSRTGSPNFVSRNSTSCRIKHTEFCGNILSSEEWTKGAEYILNPGAESTFSWLSSQALSWEKYRFVNLSFHYRTRCSTSSAGSVAMIPNYDPSDNFPFDEVSAASYANYSDDAPWKDIHVRIDSNQLNKVRFTRPHLKSLPDHTSINDFDLGKLFIGTVGGSPTSQYWGKVYVTYDVEFSSPQRANYTVSDAITVNNNAGTTINGFYLFGTEQITNDHTIVQIVPSVSKLTFYGLVPNRKYYLYIGGFGTSSPGINIILDGTTGGLNCPGGATSTTWATSHFFTAVGNSVDAIITQSGGYFTHTILYFAESNAEFALKAPSKDVVEDSSSSSSSPVFVNRPVPNLSARSVRIHDSKSILQRKQMFDD